MAITSGPIQAVALAAEGTALPTLPAAGATITWTGWTSYRTWLNIGDIGITWRREGYAIEAPLDEAPQEEVVFKSFPELIKLPLYKIDESVLALSGLATTDSGYHVEQPGEPTYMAFAIEVRGLCAWWFPKVTVAIVGAKGAIKSPEFATDLEIRVFQYSADHRPYYVKDFPSS